MDVKRVESSRFGTIELVDAPADVVRIGNRQAHVPAGGEAQRALAVDVERISRRDKDFVLSRGQRQHVESASPFFGNDRHRVCRGDAQIRDRQPESPRQRLSVHRLRSRQRIARHAPLYRSTARLVRSFHSAPLQIHFGA